MHPPIHPFIHLHSLLLLHYDDGPFWRRHHTGSAADPFSCHTKNTSTSGEEGHSDDTLSENLLPNFTCHGRHRCGVFLQLRRRKKQAQNLDFLSQCRMCSEGSVKSLFSCNQRNRSLSVSPGSGACSVMCDAAEAPPQPWLEGVINKAEVLLPNLLAFVSSRATGALLCLLRLSVPACPLLASPSLFMSYYLKLSPLPLPSFPPLLRWASCCISDPSVGKESNKGEAEPQHEERDENTLQGLGRFEVQSCTTLPMVLFFFLIPVITNKQANTRGLCFSSCFFFYLSINICRGQLPWHCVSELL